MAISGLGVGRVASGLGQSLMDYAGRQRAQAQLDAEMARSDERFDTQTRLQILGDPDLEMVNFPAASTGRMGAELMAAANARGTASGTPIYRVGDMAVRRAPRAPQPPTVTATGIGPGGVPTRVSGTPDQVGEFGLKPEPTAPATFTYKGRDFPDTPEGQQAAVAWDRQLKGADDESGMAPANAEARTRILMALPRAEEAFGVVENMVDEYGKVGESSRLDRFMPGKYFQSDEMQRYNAAAEQIATAILRVESGAAITEEEAASYARQFVPQPGDKPETIRHKMESLRQTLARMRELGGLSAEGGGSNPVAGWGNLSGADADTASNYLQSLNQGGGSTAPRNPFR